MCTLLFQFVCLISKTEGLSTGLFHQSNLGNNVSDTPKLSFFKTIDLDFIKDYFEAYPFEAFDTKNTIYLLFALINRR